MENNPEALGEELLIIQKEFSGFSDTNERLDLLALDKQGRHSITTFNLNPGRNTYTSPIIEASPSAERGVLYLVSHDNTPILIHSYRLIGIKKKTDFLQDALHVYDKKWPHLSK